MIDRTDPRIVRSKDRGKRSPIVAGIFRWIIVMAIVSSILYGMIQLTRPIQGVSQGNFAKLHKGLQIAKAQEILGKPTDSFGVFANTIAYDWKKGHERIQLSATDGQISLGSYLNQKEAILLHLGEAVSPDDLSQGINLRTFRTLKDGLSELEVEGLLGKDNEGPNVPHDDVVLNNLELRKNMSVRRWQKNGRSITVVFCLNADNKRLLFGATFSDDKGYSESFNALMRQK